MENHYYDENGLYTGSAPANAGALPPENALRAGPEKRAGYWPVLNRRRDGWEYLEDERGKRGWLNGEPCVIDRLGPPPEGWTETPPETQSSETPLPVPDMRRAAYTAEADRFRDAALSYRCEAEAWKSRGDNGAARRATEKCRQALDRYLEAKEAVRRAFPKAEEEPETSGEISDERLCLNTSGVYHRATCCSARSGGVWLDAEEIRARGDAAKPCGRCRPVLDDDVENGIQTEAEGES